jgi:hypothetical protein
MGVPDWVRNARLTYSIPPRISPWHVRFKVVPLTGSSGGLSTVSASPGRRSPGRRLLHPAWRAEVQFRAGRSRMDVPDPERAHRHIMRSRAFVGSRGRQRDHGAQLGGGDRAAPYGLCVHAPPCHAGRRSRKAAQRPALARSGAPVRAVAGIRAGRWPRWGDRAAGDRRRMPVPAGRASGMRPERGWCSHRIAGEVGDGSTVRTRGE